MKNLILTLACLLLSIYSYAQYSKSRKLLEDKNWVSLNGGLGIPLGNFGDDDINNADAGLAKLGLNGKVDLNIKMHKSLGIYVTGIGGFNNLNEEPFDKVIPQGYGISEEISSTAWKYIGGLGGISMTTGIGNGALILKGQVGFVAATSFSLDWRISSGNNYARSQVSSSKVGAFAINFGVATMLPISDIAYLNLGIDYFGTSPEFKDIVSTQSSSSSTSSSNKFDASMDIKLLMLNMGITWPL